MKYLSTYVRFWLVATVLAAGFYVFAGQYLVAFLLLLVAVNQILDARQVGMLRAENADLQQRLSERTWP
ncbi:hypothetical protein QNA23_20270 [Rhodococcus erythropolis]|uniref:hypothetical protein n=1 Tax=Rhodococcus erythropolis TaxID=1833 RepID=UPI0024BB6FAB|nr:hypothetical protein [Rhodococcus erythropolis]MDJ0405840.1 hypothetical protein [Rhodococcus erythropolis]